ncbi:MAG: LuxR family transcriptional regulator [Chloroflexi bacterium]|nr:LuxR family transcriptional regulator [Chloroflexota bacterium]MBP7042520.1 LuxR family transcriptional regulator [Chloroflexota bacterium]
MSGDLLQTKLYVPRLRPSLIPRPYLIKTLNSGLHQGGQLALISAPAGFGKTTLVTEWLAGCERPSAWLSLDDRDSDLPRFLTYLIAALQTVFPTIGADVTAVLQASPPPPTETSLTTLLNEIAGVPDNFLLVLDDYHLVDAPAVDNALAFLLDHLPPQMHLVITTREDPNLPLARLRVRGQLTELRAADLRFSLDETAVFLNQMMGLTLSNKDIAALEARTEGWIAGLQLAALSMQGHQDDVASFIQSFSGSHRFVLDYLVEEVLHQQPESVQRFLLQTAVLNQLTGSLCNALTGNDDGQKILESLERANLFLVPLDNERRWYRYHHLFAELLRQRLQQNSSEDDITALHVRASEWYEANGQELEAFQHAITANDVARAVRLIEGEGLPLYFRGEAIPVRHWLESLPESEFQARPELWVTYASVLTLTGRLHTNIEEILQRAEAALPDPALDDRTADLHGQIAANRAMLGIIKNEVQRIVTQSRRALELLHPDNMPMRTTTTWTLGYAYQIQGKRAAAKVAYAETIAQSQKSGNIMNEIAATTCVGQIQETENQAHQAAETFRRILQLMGDPPWPAACEACVGLARIHYQWNDLAAAAQYGQQGLALARQLENVDTPAACGVLLARVKLAQGDAAGALALLAETEQFVRQHHFEHWLGAVTAVRIQTFLHQGKLTAAAQLAETHELPLSQARVKLAQGDPAGALAALEPARQQAEAKEWADERLQVRVLLTLAYEMAGDRETAVQLLGDALALAAPGGLVRLFVDEGRPMATLLEEVVKQGIAPVFAQQVLEAFGETAVAPPPAAHPLPDLLSERELEVLKLLATALTGPEIARELMISLNTMRTHTKNIYSKLGVNSRRTAVRSAEELNLL